MCCSAVVAMFRQLLLLTTAVVATLGQTEVSTCGTSLSTDGKCQNETTAWLQVASVPETFPFQKKHAKTSKDDTGGPLGPAGPKHQKDPVMTSMNDWHSSRDLARVWGVQDVAISPRLTVQIFSAVPVFGNDVTYIALLVEHNGDAWSERVPLRWTHDFDAFVMFCAGPDGSHKAQVIARGNTWVCPWPHEEWETKRFSVFLEDKDGTNLGMVVAEHDPKLLGQYTTMACVRDVFYVSPESPRGRVRPFSGPFKQWVEWMEWSSMHGLEHFLLYTFEGTDLAAIDVMKPHLDAGSASRVHFQFFHPVEMSRQGHFMNDCIYRAKNHAKWLTTSMDVDEYMVFPGKVKYFDWDHVLKEQGVSEDKVASLEVSRVRFARATHGTLEISSDHCEPRFDWAKQVINVDNVYRASIHVITQFKAGTETIKADPELAVIHHYRIPGRRADYEHFDFKDASANVTDATLQGDMPLLEAAIAKRFNIQVPDVKGFLQNLAQRRPPDADTAAAAHKMQ